MSKQKHASAIIAPELDQLLGYRLRLAQIRVFDDFVAALKPFALTPGLLGVLFLIRANPGIKQTDIARAMDLDRSTMVGVLDKLTKRDWVERRASSADRRVNGVWLTAEGGQALNEITQLLDTHEQRIAQRLSETERESLMGLLDKLARV